MIASDFETEPRFSSNSEIARELLALEGRRVLDIGCGTGKFTRFLARAGAHAVGVDANENVLKTARAALRGEDVEYRHGRGEALPFPDETIDIVVFSNSLHHIALDRMGDALAEAARVCKPGGNLYVMEPVAAGNWFEATRLVNDETAVRNAAYAALRRIDVVGLRATEEVHYRVRRRFAQYEEWRDEQVARSDKRRGLFAADEERIRGEYLRHATHDAEGLTFDQHFRVNLFEKPTR